MKLQRLKKSDWKNFILTMDYTTHYYYDVNLKRSGDNFTAEFTKKKFASPVTHTSAEYNYPDRLFAPHWKGAFSYGVFDDGKLIGTIELYPENWANRLRITELWVDSNYRRKGIGTALMNKAKNIALKKNFRMIILETQSCNINAIDFYLHSDFTLVGFLSCDYSNEDLKRKEVRLEMGWFNKN